MGDGVTYAYLRVVEAFDKDPTAAQFLRDDGEGGIASGVIRMAREIDRLRKMCGEPPRRPDGWEADEDEIVWNEAEAIARGGSRA